MNDNSKINAAMLFRTFILAAYCMFLYYLIISGEISRYVHPRYNVFIGASCAVMGILIVIMIFSLKHHYHEKISPGRTVLLVLPLLLGIATKNMGDNYSDTISSDAGSSQYKLNEADVSVSIPHFINEARKKDLLELTEEHFVSILEDIYDNPGIYNGKPILVTGKVLKRKYADNKEEFAVSRLMMVCCAADAQTVGFICRYKEVHTVIAGQWYIIKGTIDVINVNDSDIPVIMVSEILKIGQPANEYVYPF